MTQVKPYWKQRSAYWGTGHWIITAHHRTLGRASKQANGKWAAYIETLPPSPRTEMVPVEENCYDIDAVFRALCEEWLKRDARRSGQEHGWDHANYIDAYGAGPKLKPGEPGAMAKTMPIRYAARYYVNGKQMATGTFSSEAEYKAGWAQGVRWFKAGKTNEGVKQT